MVENIFSMDSCVENLSQVLPSKSKIKEHYEDIHSFHNVGNSSTNSNAPVCVDCSMEEGQDESSSKRVSLDVHYIYRMSNVILFSLALCVFWDLL